MTEPAKGYSYHVSKEQLDKYGKLTPKQRLEWLEEINDFFNRFASERTRELQQKLRRGEI